MTCALNQSVGDILDNYADVIEGGNTWRGAGSGYRGIPGTHPNDPGLRSGEDTPLEVIGAQVHASYFDVAYSAWPESPYFGNYVQATRWMPQNAPGFWVLCNTDGLNYQECRKIELCHKHTGWDYWRISVSPSFTAAPSAEDSMIVLQGFKRLPDNVPPDVEGDGWDRFFSLSLDRGERLEWFGNGIQTYKGTLELRLRIIKYGRHHDAVASALENLAIIDAVITRGADPDHRDGTYTQALIPEGAPEIETEDQTKVVAVAKYGCVYRIGSEFK